MTYSYSTSIFQLQFQH